MSGVDYQRLFDALPTPHLVVTRDLKIVTANAAHLALAGLQHDEVVGRDVFEVFPPPPDALDEAGRPLLGLAFHETLITAQPTSAFVQRYDVVDPSIGESRERWWSHTVTPVLDPAGQVEMLIQRVDEVTDYVQAQELARATSSASEAALASFDGLQAQLYARSVALQAAGEAHQRTSRVLEAMPSGFLSMDTTWRFTVLNAAAERLLGHLRAELLGRTIWDAFPDVVGNEFEETYRRAVETGLPQTLEAWYPAPLDKWFEVMCWPSPDGLSLYFSDITARVEAARREARTAARLALVARVSQALTAGDTHHVLQRLPRLVVPELADSCIVTEVGPDGRARDISSWHVEERLRPALDDYARVRLVDLPPHAPFARALRTGVTELLTAETIAKVPVNSAARVHLDALGPPRGSVHPLRARDQVIGALTLLSSPARPIDPDEETTAQEIADRLGTALESSRVSQVRTQLAEDVQRSLLTEPPEPDHGQIVVRYLPASEAARVGGDWYDAFIQPSGCTTIVIGDVVGHDTAAAAAMGQIRGLLRGIAAYSDARPAEVLRGLDAAMQLLQIHTLATAAVARFEQTPDEVERGVTRMLWASAGHPPPLIVHSDGSHTLLGSGKGDLLLGVDPTTRRSEGVTELDRGATVLLYTDGLIERSDVDIDAGLARLTDAATELTGVSLDELCDGIIARLVDGHPTDDVALVAVRLHRQDRPRPAEAGPQNIPAGLPAPRHPAQ
ncbi:Putative PAS/PAC sensor protein (fragment) [Modestobacter italicus]|uniref:PAS/PAC sensor protein n=1 Tax=Modestobacter italicus (strain DSM 44449 / CECT 9708 / BC 501) TaxID=2732864 RepID=I4F0P6_MODI5